MNKSFEKFYEETFKEAYRYLYMRINNVSDVEDILHDAYLVIYESYKDKLDSNESKKILFGILQKKYVDYIRLKYREYENIEYIDNYAGEQNNVISHLDLAQLEDKLRDYIYKLEKKYPKLMIILRMRLLDKLSRREIAEVLNITEDHVHTYQKRAIAIIKKIITNEKDDENK
ncbi:MAG: sigma-70 family RNA polymerase sigma factor [Candidatus Dojkabacteria bacterium]|nr:sigma-70 family RNA polymerase sigma factor [Candidatus Dojkabacteria bacterium]